MTFKFHKLDKCWEHKTFNEDQKKDIQLALSVNNKKIKQTENFYVNMISAQKALGFHLHPQFAEVPEFKMKTDLIDPELGEDFIQPKLKNPIPKDEDEEDYEEGEESVEKQEEKEDEESKFPFLFC